MCSVAEKNRRGQRCEMAPEISARLIFATWKPVEKNQKCVVLILCSQYWLRRTTQKNKAAAFLLVCTITSNAIGSLANYDHEHALIIEKCVHCICSRGERNTVYFRGMGRSQQQTHFLGGHVTLILSKDLAQKISSSQALHHSSASLLRHTHGDCRDK